MAQDPPNMAPRSPLEGCVVYAFSLGDRSRNQDGQTIAPRSPLEKSVGYAVLRGDRSGSQDGPTMAPRSHKNCPTWFQDRPRPISELTWMAPRSACSTIADSPVKGVGGSGSAINRRAILTQRVFTSQKIRNAPPLVTLGPSCVMLGGILCHVGGVLGLYILGHLVLSCLELEPYLTTLVA